MPSQLWKIDDNRLKNKEGVWTSVDMWNFKTKDDNLIYIENISKAKFLGTTIDGKVILEDFEENKAEQLWQKGIPNGEGYFTLTNGLKGFQNQSFPNKTDCYRAF